MDSTLSTTILLASAFLIIFVSGFRLSGLGRPYGAILLNIHKLVGLAAGVYLTITAFKDDLAQTLGGSTVAITIVTIALFVLTIISGGLVSIDRPMPAIVRWIHRVAPFLTLSSAAGTVYLLSVR